MTRSSLRLLLAAALAAPAIAGAARPTICPAPGWQVERSIGAPVRYMGNISGIPDLCRMDRGNGPALFYMGIWRADWPGAGDAYPALRAVIEGPPGTSATFITRSVPGLQWQDTVTNEGPDTVVVAGRRVATLKIAHERNGIEGNVYHSIITQWRSPSTGVTVKEIEQQIAGQSYGPGATWQATRLVAPGRQ